MPVFTTTNDDWVFDLSNLPEVIELPADPTMATGYLELPGRWENYSDDILYDIEARLRMFLESKVEDPHWKYPKSTYRKYTVGMMYEVLYGKKWDPKECGPYAMRMNKIMAHYSSKIQKEGVIRGKRYKKKIYTLSLSRLNKVAPYSLKLRIEWLAERGELPTVENMKLSQEKLEPGHARNPRTEANMQKRREAAKARFNERYNKKRV